MPEQQLAMTIQVLSPAEYAFLISTMHGQFRRGELSAEDYAWVLQAFTVLDLDGAQWFFATEPGEWLQVDGDDWQPGEPRGPLMLALPARAAAEVRSICSWLREIETGPSAAQPPAARETEASVAGPVSTDEMRAPAPVIETPSMQPQPSPPLRPAAWKFCPACASQLKPGAAYCSRCGYHLAEHPR